VGGAKIYGIKRENEGVLIIDENGQIVYRLTPVS
jgi:hypothetical protein